MPYRPGWVPPLGKLEVARAERALFSHRLNMGPNRDGQFARNLVERPPVIFSEPRLAVPTYHTYGVAYLGKLEIARHVRSKFPTLSEWGFSEKMVNSNLLENEKYKVD